jgi:hypothetical protein
MLLWYFQNYPASTKIKYCENKKYLFCNLTISGWNGKENSDVIRGFTITGPIWRPTEGE